MTDVKQKIQLVSDLHLEFRNYEWDLPVTDAEVVVFAGDIGVGTKSIDWFNKQLAIHNKPFVYVLGNHEFYHHDLEDVRCQWETFSDSTPNFHYLENRTAIINGITFIGGTLWTNCENSQDNENAIQRNLNDFRIIRYKGNTLTAKDTTEMFYYTQDYIRFMLENTEVTRGKTVVVTHHAPSYISSAPQFKGSNINCAFASDLEKFIGGYDIDLWCHGHMHNFSDYVVGDTRVVANPKGYPDEMDYGTGTFNPSLVIEV